jgi:glycerol-3-phosphate acyltransferase PlsY
MVVLSPALVLPLLGVWALMLIATGYVGLSTIIAVVAFPVMASTMPVTGSATAPTLRVFAIAVALLIVFTHRENVVRLIRGTEFRFEKARLLHRLAQRLG